MDAANSSLVTNGTHIHHPIGQQNAPKDVGIVVAARIRPFNKKELMESAVPDPTPIAEIESSNPTVTLLDPGNNYSEKAVFSFDHVFSAFRPSIEILDVMSEASHAHSDSPEATDDVEEADRAQAEIFECMGTPVLNSAWEGYNGCIFAYGQTSSGKTYTMMGTKRCPGIIPRLCRSLFEKIEMDELNQAEDGADSMKRRLIKVTVSYMEIYNEQVRDLLRTRPKNARLKFASRFDTRDLDYAEFQNLKVRQHPLHGPFVDGITKIDVESWLECVKIIRTGNEVRTSAETEMNEQSSRSHAIFQLVLTQTEALGARVRGKEVSNHRVSKINLVDLAGSERLSRTNVTGKHVTEANAINQSLSTLRKVLEALIAKAKKPGSVLVIPYRESMLTWILSDNFGGNSRTAMMATVSPHENNAAETESTLRYALLAKGVINRVRVNEDPAAKLIKELQHQLKALQEEVAWRREAALNMTGTRTMGGEERMQELEFEIEENKKAMEELHSREEGMRQLIQEGRLREEKLLAERENLATSEEKWKREAQRLLKEKEQLQATLSSLAQNNPQLLLINNKDSKHFWDLSGEDKDKGRGSEDAGSGEVQDNDKKKGRNNRRPTLTKENDSNTAPSHANEADNNSSKAPGNGQDKGSKDSSDAATKKPLNDDDDDDDIAVRDKSEKGAEVQVVPIRRQSLHRGNRALKPLIPTNPMELIYNPIEAPSTSLLRESINSIAIGGSGRIAPNPPVTNGDDNAGRARPVPNPKGTPPMSTVSTLTMPKDGAAASPGLALFGRRAGSSQSAGSAHSVLSNDNISAAGGNANGPRAGRRAVRKDGQPPRLEIPASAPSISPTAPGKVIVAVPLVPSPIVASPLKDNEGPIPPWKRKRT